MKTSAVRVLLAAAFFVAPAAAQACSYGSPVYYSTPYYAPTYRNVEVKKYTVLEFVQPYFVGVAAPYVAPAAATPATPTHASPCSAEVATLRAELERLKSRLSEFVPMPGRYDERTGEKLPGGKVLERWPDGTPKKELVPAPPPMAPVAGAAGRSVFAAKCAGCHDASVARAKGGKLELFQNGVALPLPPAVAMESLRQMMAGKMPKGGTLTDQDFTLIQQEILSAPGR